MVALFCGSRKWTDVAAIERDVAELPADAVVLHGGARGADMIAHHAARRRGLHTARVDALWSQRGKRAGMDRNRAMLQLKPDVVFAYPLGGPGTAGMVREAIAAGVEVRVRRPDGLA